SVFSVVNKRNGLEAPFDAEHRQDRQRRERLELRSGRRTIVVVEDRVAAVERVEKLQVGRDVEHCAVQLTAPGVLDARVDTEVGALGLVERRAGDGCDL